MAVKLFDVTLTAAQIQALTASHYYWIDRVGNLVDVGGATLVATAAVPAPTDQAVIELSMWQAIELYVSHGVLTGGVGGKLSLAALTPDLLPPVGSPVVAGGTTIDTTLAATLEHLTTGLVNPPTVGRGIKGALAILWTTVPTGASLMRISVWGHRDGQDRARG